MHLTRCKYQRVSSSHVLKKKEHFLVLVNAVMGFLPARKAGNTQMFTGNTSRSYSPQAFMLVFVACREKPVNA